MLVEKALVPSQYSTELQKICLLFSLERSHHHTLTGWRQTSGFNFQHGDTDESPQPNLTSDTFQKEEKKNYPLICDRPKAPHMPLCKMKIVRNKINDYKYI